MPQTKTKRTKTTPTEVSQQTVNQFVASAHGNLTMVKDMLKQHPQMIDSKSSQQERAIEAAAHTGQLAIVNYLLEEGAELDICTAALLGRTKRVKDWIEGSPEQLNAKGAHGIPLLYYAALGGDQELVEHLLESGVNVNAGDGLITALHGAVLGDHDEIVTTLARHGARADVTDYAKKTPIDVANKHEKSKAHRALMKAFPG